MAQKWRSCVRLNQYGHKRTKVCLPFVGMEFGCILAWMPTALNTSFHCFRQRTTWCAVGRRRRKSWCSLPTAPILPMCSQLIRNVYC